MAENQCCFSSQGKCGVIFARLFNATMKKLIPLAIVGFTAFLALDINAQSDAVFHSVKYTLFADYYQTTPTAGTFVDPFSGESIDVQGRVTGSAFLTLVYDFRYNLHELNDDVAISGIVSPAFGLSGTTTELFLAGSAFGTFAGVGSLGGFGYLNLSVMPGIEYGAGATYNSSKSVGTFFRVGFDYMLTPITSFDGEEDFDFDGGLNGWTGLAMQSGIRYYSKKNRLREVNLKFWPGGKGQLGLEERSGLHLRLTWGFILDY